jgi:hypothetical protein
MKYQVAVNKYSHEGSGFAYIESLHDTKDAADKHAKKILSRYRFAVVSEARSNAKIYDNA